MVEKAWMAGADMDGKCHFARGGGLGYAAAHARCRPFNLARFLKRKKPVSALRCGAPEISYGYAFHEGRSFTPW